VELVRKDEEDCYYAESGLDVEWIKDALPGRLQTEGVYPRQAEEGEV